MKKVLFITFCLLMSLTISAFSNSYSDIADRIFGNLKSGNSKEIAKDFSSSVSMSVIQDEGVYNKFQAELILSEFFMKNKPLRLHTVQRTSNNTEYNYFVYQLITAKSAFRVFVKVNRIKSDPQIVEFRIEKQSTN
ncbi:DUF4783 domain-containing protein [Sphingobacteriaceae bacterium WQ 2009]|uniref:DUF4783 domain-containing protein n=1 Tax=Rhinopithecimicrobium faecis TaxID=2820698 RepID=A0A8T4HA88_9SPHI|nr:DUF4783 domain-containing protein [Sphingobacteriaceae bacterium WQ 2009]